MPIPKHGSIRKYMWKVCFYGKNVVALSVSMGCYVHSNLFVLRLFDSEISMLNSHFNTDVFKTFGK